MHVRLSSSQGQKSAATGRCAPMVLLAVFTLALGFICGAPRMVLADEPESALTAQTQAAIGQAVPATDSSRECLAVAPAANTTKTMAADSTMRVDDIELHDIDGSQTTFDATYGDGPVVVIGGRPSCGNTWWVLLDAQYMASEPDCALKFAVLDFDGDFDAFKNEYLESETNEIRFYSSPDLTSWIWRQYNRAGMDNDIVPLPFVFLINDGVLQKVSTGMVDLDNFIRNDPEPEGSENPSVQYVKPQVETPSIPELVARYNELGGSGLYGSSPLYDAEARTGANYAPGVLSTSTLEQATKILNFYRYMAGVPSTVALSTDLSAKAQLGSLANAGNDVLSHHPIRVPWMSNADWNVASAACSSSNIGMGHFTLGDFVYGCMSDDGSYDNRSTVGHRRWFLNPCMDAVGWGFVPKAQSGASSHYCSAYVFSSEGSSTAENICWPAQNQMINAWAQGSPWSIMVGSPLDVSTVQVTLTRKADGKQWKFSKYKTSDGDFFIDNATYGTPGCIIFDPNGLSEHAGDVYTVTVDGIPQPLQYDVTFWGIESVHRLYNPYTREHLFTVDAGEVDELQFQGWQYEQVEWASPNGFGTPVYRLYNEWTHEHLYTANKNEYDTLSRQGWTGEGEKLSSASEDGEPVYRLFNPWETGPGAHHYTTSTSERQTLISQGWSDEGIYWYGLKNPTSEPGTVDPGADPETGDPGADVETFKLYVFDGVHWDEDKYKVPEDVDPSHFLSGVSFTITNANGVVVHRGVVGRGGASVALPVGDYSIAFSKEGYRDVRHELTVHKNLSATGAVMYRE